MDTVSVMTILYRLCAEKGEHGGSDQGGLDGSDHLEWEDDRE